MRSSTLIVRGFVASIAIAAVIGSSPALAASNAGRAATAATAPIAVATTTCTPGAHACPIRITFALGAYTAQGHSTLAGVSSAKWFSVSARAGQQMIVWIVGRGPTRGVVYFPNGQQDGQPGGRVFDGSLPVTGTYRIVVTEDSMAEAWSGRVDVVLLIV
jgi:hypothetical protein